MAENCMIMVGIMKKPENLKNNLIALLSSLKWLSEKAKKINNNDEKDTNQLTCPEGKVKVIKILPR